MNYAAYADLFTHLVVAIVCAAAGLIIWDVGTRPPDRVAKSILTTMSSTPRILATGILRFTIGSVFLFISAMLVYYAVPVSAFKWYTVFEIIALLCGLSVELLIGEDVRVLLGLRRGRGTP